ncbi:alpha/beta hydrolase [Arthrobacter sp. UYEF36]|uniref:alpha/beta fold hydrolase n=1 Tax=Arthrobacter sp. UYEF36 TaxID=1756366 RepID=UPI003390C876
MAPQTKPVQEDFARMVDIGGGRQIWATCKGQGSPTVVLLSGHGNGAEDWSLILDPNDPVHQTPLDDVSAGLGKLVTSDAAVFPSVARTTRVCTYDRSDIRFTGEVTTPRPQPHTVDLDVSDLHSLLAAIGERGPYVFVSHSYGGLISTLYARTYPESIAGLVMVDTVSEVMQDLVTPGALDWWDQVNAATNDVVREGVMIKDAFAQINAAGTMPKVPSIVLVADKPFHEIPPETLQGEHTTFTDWLAMVNKLGANLGAKTITKTNSGHNIYLYNPKLVIDSIDEIVDDVRTTSTASTPQATDPAARPTAAGQEDIAGTFDIGGRKMYMQCTGHGSPTVILISGGGIAADLWDSPLGKQPTVYPTIAKTTRVCAYDRPGTTRARAEGGISRSDSVPQPVTPSSSVADLHALLAAAGETGPFVLAAHSYGGLVARLFAHQHPTEVAGMALVDSFSPELREAMADLWPSWIAWNTTPAAIVKDYPDYERVDFDKALDEFVANRTIPPMPLVVLTADKPYPAPTQPGIPANINIVTREAQDVSQRQVAQLVPGAEHITKTDSGHDIMLENPVLVSDAIVDVITAVRNGRTSIN